MAAATGAWGYLMAPRPGKSFLLWAAAVSLYLHPLVPLGFPLESFCVNTGLKGLFNIGGCLMVSLEASKTWLLLNMGALGQEQPVPQLNRNCHFKTT